MKGKNIVIVAGNLGKDIEIRYTQSGTAVCNLNIAVNESIKKDGEWVDHVEWVTATVWGKTAENCGKYLNKGSPVLIEGKMRTTKYKAKDGEEKWKTEISADSVTFLGNGEQKSGGGSPARGASKPKSSSPAPEENGGFIDDDLPFMRYEPGHW